MLQLQAIGNLGSDCEVKVMSNGKKVINFSIAHTEKWSGADGNKYERTVWVECGLWEKENLAPYLKKGQQVYVSGTPSTTAYTSKKDGSLQSTLRLNVFQLQLLGGKKEADNSAGTPGNGNAPTDGNGGAADDLPF